MAPAPAPLQTRFPPAPGPSPVQLIANLILADANLSLPLSQADEQNIIQSVLQVLPSGYSASDISLGSAQSLAQAASAPAFSTGSQAGRRLLQVGVLCVALTSAPAHAQVQAQPVFKCCSCVHTESLVVPAALHVRRSPARQ